MALTSLTTFATTRPTRTARTGDLALPDRLAGRLGDGHQGCVRPSGSADDFVAVDERGLAIAPHGDGPAELLREADLPHDLAVLDLEAGEVAAHAEDVEPIAVHRGGAARTFLRLRHALLVRRPEGRRPDLLAVRLGQGPDDLVAAAFAHPVDPPTRDGRGRVAAAQSLGFPREGRTVLAPFLEEAGFLGDCRPIGPLPLGPVVGEDRGPGQQ